MRPNIGKILFSCQVKSGTKSLRFVFRPPPVDTLFIRLYDFTIGCSTDRLPARGKGSTHEDDPYYVSLPVRGRFWISQVRVTTH